MKTISNHVDRYRAAVNDEKAVERAQGALATARSRIQESAGRDISPELARELHAVDEALRPLFGRLVVLAEQTRNRAQAIASAAVSETCAEDDGPVYECEWEEPTDPTPFDGEDDDPLFIGSFIGALSGEGAE